MKSAGLFLYPGTFFVMMNMAHVKSVLTIVLLSLMLLACSSATRTQYQYSGSAMGTTYHVKVVFDQPASELRMAELQKNTESVLSRIDHLMSTYKDDSEVSRFNRLMPGMPLRVSNQTIDVLTAASAISEQTTGAFDVTVGPLVDLWGFGSGSINSNKPDQNLIDSALELLDWSALSINETASVISKSKAIQVDLSAIAKGYAVDQVAAFLDSQKIDNYMVEIGGELVAAGVNQKSEPWRLGIEQPDFGGRKAYTVVSLHQRGLATSGDYRNYFEQDGIRYSHTIDPRTGYPVRHLLASVSVIADSCMTADALATALMVMGEVEGYQFALEQGVGAYFIYRNGDGFASKSTPEFERFLN
jgi:thiamine biosynthesis lipoprotein